MVDDESSPTSASATPSANGSPLGIGLAVVARYVRNMKGQIRVHSEPGKGTIFGIEVPFEHANNTTDEASSKGFPLLPHFPRAMSDTSSTKSTVTSSKQTSTEEIVPTKFTPTSEVGPSPSLSTGSELSSAVPSPQTQTAHSISLSMARYPFPPMVDVRRSSLSSQRETLAVLIAEDNPINSRLLTRRLVKLGHDVHLALDGQECHDHFAAQPQQVDVILMDIQVRHPSQTDVIRANLD